MDSLTGVASGDVRFTPESRRFEPTPWMSAYDPKRTLGARKTANSSRDPVFYIEIPQAAGYQGNVS